MQELPLREIELTDTLKNLADTVGWWPPAIGWWFLLLFVTILCISVIQWWRHRERGNTIAVAEARQILQVIQKNYRQDGNLSVLISAISTLMRRLCISLFPRGHTASLLADDWLLFLDQTMGENPNSLAESDKPFSQGVGKILSTGPYNLHPEGVDGEQLLLLCQQWIFQVEKYAKGYQKRLAE